jgi:hydrogenase maturation protein HypF
MSAAPASAGGRLRVRVRGAVQGVGFRPFVHALAGRYGLSGYVLNDAEGVLAEVEGPCLADFLGALTREAPPLARIEAVDLTRLDRRGDAGFAIRQSPALGAGRGRTRGVPDAATCAACLNELFDPASRFHLYPFITCTDCGPRFTITRALPYDRTRTAMAGFALCAACRADHADPGGRRHHAETIACPVCGPRLSQPIQDAAVALRAGAIVALKGIGGYHLLCDARNARAVETLRQRKRRPRRPFAVMAANEASAELFAAPTAAERRLMAQAARPIVLVRAGGALMAGGLAAEVAPGLDRVGVMLPAAPVHHLLFHALAGRPEGTAWLDAPAPLVLVATSANIAGRPLVIDEAEAADLAGVADLIIGHDRPILARADDSVMAVIDGAPAFIRRGRGFTPEPIDLGPIDPGDDGPCVLAVGGHLKATLCVTRGREAFLSAHIGDLGAAPTVRVYEETALRMLEMLDVTPALIVCDSHPDYRSTLFAEGLSAPLLRVQHHAAHLAAVAAEHRLNGPLLGAALDGYGHGDDGEAWGGELMRRLDGSWRRIGQIWPLAAPGGDRAAREPWRMGVAALAALGLGHQAADRFPGVALAGPLAACLARGDSVAATSSLGRLFDAAAALLGVCTHQSYDGQAAMELEALATAPKALDGGYAIHVGVLDFRPLLAALLSPGLNAVDGANLFHGTLIAGLADWIERARHPGDGADVALGGGCLLNRTLAEGLAGALRARGRVPWLPRQAPANDGGLSLGQAALGRAHLAFATDHGHGGGT